MNETRRTLATALKMGKGRLKGNTNVAKIFPNMNNTEKMMMRPALA